MADKGRVVGIVSAVIPSKDFGFIVVEGEEGEYFFHSTAVRGNFEDIYPGDKVEFDIVVGGKGKRAVGVEKK